MEAADIQTGEQFKVYVMTFSGSPGGHARRMGTAFILPGRVRVQVSSRVVPISILNTIIDGFTNREQMFEIDLNRVRIVRNWGERKVCLLSLGDKKEGVALIPASLWGQKKEMDQFVHVLETAWGQTIVTEDLMHRKLMLKIFGGLAIVAIVALLAALVFRMLGGSTGKW